MTSEEYLRFLQERARTGYTPQERVPVPEQQGAGIREFRLPDGRKITADEGLSEEEVMDVAKKRFPESFNVRRYSPPVDDDSSPLEAFGSSFTRTTKGIVPGARAFGSVLSGDQEGYEAAQKDIAEASEAAMEIAPSLVTTDDISKAYEEDGLLSAAAKSMEFGTEQIFSSVGRMAPAMAAGGAGALAGSMIAPGVGTLIGGVLGFSGVNLASYLSEDLERAYEEGAANIEDVEAGKTFAAAAGQTALDNLGFLVAGAAAAPAKAIAGIGAKAAGESVVRNSARGAAGKFLNRINNTTKTKAFLGTLVEEEVAEIGQQALERWQAGLEVSPADEEAAQEYLEIAFATLFPSAGFAGLTVGGMKAKEKYGLQIETGKKKMGDKLFEISRGLIKLSEQDKARNLEEQAEDAVQGIRDDAIVTVEDIHNVANDRNILWDDDAGFMSFSHRKTGSYDLDSIQEDQTELRKIYDRISAMPRQDVPSSLQLASEEEAVLLASKLSKKKSKKFTMAGVKSALKLKDANVSEEVADQIAQGHIDKMADMGVVSIDDKGKMSVLPQDKSVDQKIYDQVIEVSRERGSFPTFRQFTSEHGFTDKKSMEQYEAIKARALVRGDIVQSGQTLAPVVLDPSYTEDGFRIMVDGELQPSWYSSREDAEADANNLYAEEGQVTFDQAESDRLAAEGLSGMELELREAGVRSSTTPEQRVIKEVQRDRAESNIEIVESPKAASVEAAKGFDYRVSGKKRKMFVARDRGGSVLKIFSSRKKADTYLDSRRKNSFSFDVTVGGSVIGRFKSRADAQQRLKGHKAEIESRFTEDARRTLQEQGIFAPNLIEREASKRGAADAKNYFRREKTKIERIGVDPGIEVSKEEGFVLSERKVAEGGREYAPKTVGFYETEAVANQAKQSAELGRVGAESWQGKIDEKMSPAEAAEISLKRENPELAAKAVLPPPPPEQSALVQKVTTTLNNELRKSRGLEDFTVNLSRSMAEEGQSLATFNDATRVITIAFTPELENMAEADVVRTLAPLMNHETIHAFRKLGAIKAKEWSNLTRFVANKKLPESRIQELNTELVNLGKQPVPEGATYLDYAINLYSDSGNKIEEINKLREQLESGVINEDAHKELLLAVEQTKWIKDDYVEEAVAFAYQDWSENPTSISGQPRNLMERMTNVVRKMGRALRGQGYNSAEEIFETLYGDQMAARIQAGKSLDLWWSRRPGEMAGVANDIDIARAQTAKLRADRRSSVEESIRQEASEKGVEISDDEVRQKVDKVLSDEGYGSVDMDEASIFDEVARLAAKGEVDAADAGEPREREARGLSPLPKGAPPQIKTRRDLNNLRRVLARKTKKGEPGRFWYEQSGKAFLNFVNNDIDLADKFAQIMGIYSAGASVPSQIPVALRAWYQWRNGQEINSGGTEKDAKVNRVLYENKDWDGRKTSDFYGNMMQTIDPSRVADLKRVTVDRWMMRAFGFRTDSPTVAQERFVRDEVVRIADRIGWTPYQVQAAIWVEHKSSAEKTSLAEVSKGDFGTMMNARFGQLSWEAVPGITNGHMAGWENLPTQEIIAYTKDISEAFLDNQGQDVLAKVLGVLSPGQFEAPGFYEGRQSPGAQTKFIAGRPRGPKGQSRFEITPDARALLDAYASYRGLLTHQDAMAWTRPIWEGSTPKADQNLTLVSIGRTPTAQETQRMAEAVNATAQDEFFAPISTEDGWMFLNAFTEYNPYYSEGTPDSPATVDNLAFQKMIRDSISLFEGGEISRIEVSGMAADSNYIYQGDIPDGQVYREAITQIPPDLQREADSVFADIQERIDTVDRQFAERNGLVLGPDTRARLGDSANEVAPGRGVGPLGSIGEARSREARALGDIRKATSGQMYRSPIPDSAYSIIRPPGARPGDSSPNNISWGIGRFDGMGKYLKAGTRIVVLDGYHEDAFTMPGGKKIKAKGFGRKHIEKHDEDIRDYTPYTDWKELLTAFFRELKNQPRRITGGPIIPYAEPGSLICGAIRILLPPFWLLASHSIPARGRPPRSRRPIRLSSTMLRSTLTVRSLATCTVKKSRCRR